MKKSIKYYEENLESFELLFKLYKDYNSHTNISAIRDKQAVIVKHFIDSLEILDCFDFPAQSRVIDIGSGAGFPVVPLAIVCKNINFFALDATEKKTNFITELKDKLGLKNLQVITGRAEDFAHQKQYRESFDFVLARAVASLRILFELSSGFLRKDGRFCTYKKFPIEIEEVEAVNSMHVTNFVFKDRYKLNPIKQILVYSKSKPLANNYPRSYNQIKSNPL